MAAPTASPASETAPQRRSFGASIEKLSSGAKTLQGLLLGVGGLGLSAFVIAHIAYELVQDGLRIEPVQAPPSLVSRGFTPVVLGQELLEGVVQIRDRALTARQKQQMAPGWRETDISIPGSRLSLDTVVRFLKWYENRIFGSITVEDDGNLKLRLRSSGDVFRLPENEAIVAADVDTLIDHGARAIMMVTDPFLLAAYVYFEEIDRRAACRLLRLALNNDDITDDSWAYNLWGLILSDYGLQDQAAEKFRLALELDPDFVQPMNNWALLISKSEAEISKEERERAEGLLREAIGLDPDFAQPWINLAVLKFGDQTRPPHTDELVAELDTAIALDPGSPHAYYSRAAVLGQLGHVERAIADAWSAIDTKANYSPAYVLLGQLSNAEDAEAMYRRALQLDPDNARAWVELGLLELERAKTATSDPAFHFGRARSMLESAVALNPSSISAPVAPVLARLRKLGMEPAANEGQPLAVVVDRHGCPSVQRK